ncbi:MAG: sodium:calcium antiporter, partial [Planctomycetota bacterium]
IADTGLIFGACCLLTPIPLQPTIVNRQGWWQFGAGIVLAIVCYTLYALYGEDAAVGRAIGVVFLVALAVYLYLSVKWVDSSESEEAATTSGSVGKLLVGVFISLAIVIFASRFLICSAIEAAERFEVPKAVIASTLVALGTSVPELVVGIKSVIKKTPGLLVGNVIGADVLNVLFVTGAAAVAAPLELDAAFLYLALPTMLGILILFRIFIFVAMKPREFSRWMGVPMVAIYVGYIVLCYVLDVSAH